LRNRDKGTQSKAVKKELKIAPKDRRAGNLNRRGKNLEILSTAPKKRSRRKVQAIASIQCRAGKEKILTAGIKPAWLPERVTRNKEGLRQRIKKSLANREGRTGEKR